MEDKFRFQVEMKQRQDIKHSTNIIMVAILMSVVILMIARQMTAIGHRMKSGVGQTQVLGKPIEGKFFKIAQEWHDKLTKKQKEKTRVYG